MPYGLKKRNTSSLWDGMSPAVPPKFFLFRSARSGAPGKSSGQTCARITMGDAGSPTCFRFQVAAPEGFSIPVGAPASTVPVSLFTLRECTRFHQRISSYRLLSHIWRDLSITRFLIFTKFHEITTREDLPAASSFFSDQKTQYGSISLRQPSSIHSLWLVLDCIRSRHNCPSSVKRSFTPSPVFALVRWNGA